MTRAQRRTAQVVEVEHLGPGLGRIELEGDNLAEGVTPGRFAMVEAPGREDCVLLRPYSYFSTTGTHRVGLLVKDVGKGTSALLSAKAGDKAVVLGPLGSSFPEITGRCWIVAGGVGAAPFGVMQHKDGTEILFGARTTGESGFARALEARGARVHLATDDGSSGFRGTAVDLLKHRLQNDAAPEMIFTCGPTVMMAAAAQVARQHGIACWASLEERMGCGIGICRGCAHRDAVGSWRCICVDGPVYDATEIFAP